MQFLQTLFPTKYPLVVVVGKNVCGNRTELLGLGYYFGYVAAHSLPIIIIGRGKTNVLVAKLLILCPSNVINYKSLPTWLRPCFEPAITVVTGPTVISDVATLNTLNSTSSMTKKMHNYNWWLQIFVIYNNRFTILDYRLISFWFINTKAKLWTDRLDWRRSSWRWESYCTRWSRGWINCYACLFAGGILYL